MNKEESNIVSLHGGSIAISLSPKSEAFKSYCESRCLNIEVDEDNRTITCRECSRVLDPFDYLLKWANKADRRMSGVKALEAEEKNLSAKVQNLKKEVAKWRKNLRKEDPENPILKDPYSLNNFRIVGSQKIPTHS